jgi:flagellar basal-body rod protein FlgC
MPMSSIISSSLSALNAFGKKMAVITHNVANSQTNGFKKSRVDLKEDAVNGVSPEIRRIETPGHLIAVESGKGSVEKETSNVNLAEEFTQATLTSKHYQANLKLIDVEDELMGSLLDIVS